MVCGAAVVSCLNDTLCVFAAGGPFDPLGLSDGPQYETYKLKEVKNGR
jgi:hypothetical protein